MFTYELESKLPMPIGERGPAPYAPSHAVIRVIEHVRDRSIPPPITADKIARLGVGKALAPRTYQTMKMLDLIDDDGNPTQALEDIRIAASDELRALLDQWFRAAYEPILHYIDPSASVDRILDQFRRYDPAGQRSRMVTLFLGLAAYAGLISEVPTLPRKSESANGKKASKPKAARSERKPKDQPDSRKGAPKHESPDVKQPNPLDPYTQRYLEYLLAKLEGQSDPPAELLDRIERVILHQKGGES